MDEHPVDPGNPTEPAPITEDLLADGVVPSDGSAGVPAAGVNEPEATPPPRGPGWLRRPVRAGRRASYREGMTFSSLTFGAFAVMGVISSVANSRLYGIDVIGQYALAMTTVQIVRMLSTAKERPALIRELTQLEPRHPRVTGLFVAMLVFSIVLTIVVAAISLVITSVLFKGPISEPAVFLPTAVNVAGYALIGNTSDNFDVVFQGYRASRQTFWGQLAVLVSSILISVGWVLFINPTVWGLIIAQVGSLAIGLLQRVVMVRKYMRFTATRQVLRDGFRTLPGLISFGLKITPGAFADGASNASSTWIVGAFNRIATVGAYGRAINLVQTLQVLNAHTNVMLFPTLVERRAKNDGEGYARALVDTLRYTTFTLLLPAAAGGGVAEGVMRVFGPGFARGADALAILLLVPPLVVLTQIQRNALYSLDRPSAGSVSGILRLVVTLATGILLTWQIGIDGAAIGMVLGLLADFAFSSRIVRPHLTTPFAVLWPLRERFVLFAACAGGFISARLVYNALGYPFGIFAGTAAGLVVLIAIVIAGGAVNHRDRQRIAEVRQMIAKRRAKNATAGV